MQAYERAGADVIYAPWLREVDQIRAVSEATSKPLNVLALSSFSVSEIVEAGGQRLSVGGWLTWVSVDATAKAAKQILEHGDLSVLNVQPKIKEWLSR